jgi:hypothetical protein
MTADLADVIAYDNAIPAAWLRRLRKQVADCRGAKSNGWYSLSERPRTFFEQVVRHLHPIARPGADCIWAEYWMRVQPPTAVFHFHFDRDEAIRTSFVCPKLGSILYLSDAGGPTLIVDLTPTSRAVPKRGVAMVPRGGRYAIFPGSLLHGVQGGERNRWPRIAFYVNWWAHKPLSCSDVALPLFRRWSPPLANLGRSQKPERANGVPIPFEAKELMEPDQWRAFIDAIARDKPSYRTASGGLA